MWNLITEVIRREYGISRHSGIYYENSNSFNQNCLGSRFIAQRMQQSCILDRCDDYLSCLSFNNGGELLCAANMDKQIVVYDWARSTIANILESQHFSKIFDMKFLATDGDDLDLISTSRDGKVGRTRIIPSGEVVFRELFISLDSVLRITTVPRSSSGLLLASSRGAIYQIDVRCNQQTYSTPVTFAKHTNETNLSINGVTHHPFAPEFAVFGDDSCINVYDKRNLKFVNKKIYLKSEGIRSWIYECSYNYNGRELLARLSPEGTFLVENEMFGETLHFYDKSDISRFFGPKSQYVIFAKSVEQIAVCDKITEDIINIVAEDRDVPQRRFQMSYVETHPYLPVIACSGSDTGIIIWTPIKRDSQ